jgi:hypothetical protein
MKPEFIYMVGLGLISAGTYSYFKALGPLDNTRPIIAMRSVFFAINISMLIWGFFEFSWYAPLIGFWLVSPLFVMSIMQLLSPIIFRELLVIIFGLALCLYSLL